MARFPSALRYLALTGAAALVTTGCAAGAPSSSSSQSATGSASQSSAQADGDSQRKEVRRLSPRAVLSYDGGLMTVDTATGKVVGTTQREGFLRLNPAGDGRHVMVSDGDSFRVFDAGLQTQRHGDHSHYFTAVPTLTEVAFDAPHAGHVTRHAGRTTLFGDGDGSSQTFDAEALTEAVEQGKAPQTTQAKAENPHHGVAVRLTDGSLFSTRGTADERHEVRVTAPDGTVTAHTEDCPGVHGEAAAAPSATGDVVMAGCQNGPVVYRDGAFHKVSVPDAYARSGNLAGSEDSPVVLGDYKTQKDAELERPTRVALFDTRNDSHRLVDLGSPYWFRSLARGPQGEGLVLTYDGRLNVIDQNTGEITRRIDVVKPWQEKEDWQEPGPAVQTAGDKAYVTDAEDRKLHVVNLVNGTVERSIDLPETPVEMSVVTGRPETKAEKS